MNNQKPTTILRGKSGCMNLLLFLILNISTPIIYGQINDDPLETELDINDLETASLSEPAISEVANSSKINSVNKFKLDFGFTDETTILKYPNNFLQVFNRWGTRVYHKKGYKHDWNGHSTGLATMGVERKIPIGTYYYILDLGNGTTTQKTGWLYISK